MHLPDAARLLFHKHKSDPDHSDSPSLFEPGIGDWILDLTALALIALVIGTVLRWAYLAIFYR